MSAVPAVPAIRATCVWFTGAPAAGKSTLSLHLARLLQAQGRVCCALDGDVLRAGLNRDLGFSALDRAESVRRAAETARLLVDAGIVALVSLVSPFAADRHAARRLFQPGQFIEVHVQADLQTRIARDPKGLYRRAMAAEISNLTGWDAPYEPPEAPELAIDTLQLPAAEAAQRIVALLLAHAVDAQPARLAPK